MSDPTKRDPVWWDLCLLAQTEEFSEDVRMQIQRGANTIESQAAEIDRLRKWALCAADALETKDAEIARLRKLLADAERERDGYNIMGLAEEQRQTPGPFVGPGTPNAMLGIDAAKETTK